MAKKKVNPRRRPATQADVKKAKQDAVDDVAGIAWAILMTVLLDKEGYTPEDLQRVWDEVDELSDSIARGYVNVANLRNTLRTEAGVDIK